MNLDSGRYTILMLLMLSCMTPVLSFAVEEDTGLLIAVGRAISLIDVDSSKPIEYSRQDNDVIIDLRYTTHSPVEIRIFGDGTVRGERIHSTSVISANGVFSSAKVKHTFTTQLSEAIMNGMLKSLTGLFNFDLSAVKKELSESANCWRYCPDVIISHEPSITAKLEINVLQYKLYSGETMDNVSKIIKWDKTDVFDAASKFPQVYSLQELKRAIEGLLDFCDCLPSHAR
jgi:Pyruvate/2-oxoacid:ferredoxin oxidoreductase delta subunit